MKVLMLRTNKVDPDPRVEKEATSLIKNPDIELSIHAWDREKNHKCIKENLNLPTGNVPIYRIGIKGNWGKGMKNNILPALRYELYLFFWLLFNIKKYDVIHAFDLMTGYPALIPAKIFKKKIVYDCCDYYADSQHGPEFIMRKLRKMETKVFEKSDYSIICSEKRINQIAPAKPKKLSVIHNSPDIENFKIDETSDNKICKSDSKRLKLVYVGNFCHDRWLVELAESVKKLNDKVELHIGGFGGLGEKIEEISKTTDNIYVYGKMQYGDVLKLEKECDCIVALYETHLKNHIYAAPNKFYEALAIGKPLLMIKNSGMSEIVEKEKIGVIMDTTFESFSESINKLTELVKDKKLSKKMNTIFENEYSWKIMENRLNNIYEEVAKKNI